MLSDFIRRCFVAPEVEEEVLSAARETRKAAESARRAAQATEKAVRKTDIVGLIRVVLGFAFVGVFTAGMFAAKNSGNAKPHNRPEDESGKGKK